MTFLQLPDDYEIAEIRPPAGIWNRTVGDIKMQTRYELNLITIKREYEVINDQGQPTTEAHIFGIPKENTIIYDTDTIIVLGKEKDIERFIEINS
jgi:trk system potassium uptake protein TrkA